MYWHSSNGKLQLNQMTLEHFTNAFAVVKEKIKSNNTLPRDLVVATQRDLLFGYTLLGWEQAFIREWQRRKEVAKTIQESLDNYGYDEEYQDESYYKVY